MFFHKYGNNTYKLIQFNVLCDFSKRFWRWLFHHKRNMCVVWMVLSDTSPVSFQIFYHKYGRNTYKSI